MKRSPLERKTPLKRGTSELKRTPLKQVSKKRQELNRKRRTFVDEMLKDFRYCQVGVDIKSVDESHWCQVRSVDVHEIKTRARGGSIIDRANCLAICRSCHDWIHRNPKQATDLGFLESQWMSRND